MAGLVIALVLVAALSGALWWSMRKRLAGGDAIMARGGDDGRAVAMLSASGVRSEGMWA